MSALYIRRSHRFRCLFRERVELICPIHPIKLIRQPDPPDPSDPPDQPACSASCQCPVVEVSDYEINGLLITESHDMFNAQAGADLAAAIEEILNGGLVAGADVFGGGDDAFAAFKVFEGADFAEGEVEFGTVEDLVDDHVMAAAAEMGEGGLEFVAIVEEIAEDDDDAAAFGLFGKTMKGRGHVGFGGGLVLGELSADDA